MTHLTIIGFMITTVIMCCYLFRCSLKPWAKLRGKEAWKAALKDKDYRMCWFYGFIQVGFIITMGLLTV
jgi:hypothetical protein